MYTTIHTHTSARAGALTRRHASGRARVKPTRAKPHACKVYVYVLAMRSASVHTPTQTHTHTSAQRRSRTIARLYIYAGAGHRCRPPFTCAHILHTRSARKNSRARAAAHAHNQRTYVHTYTHTLTRSSSHYVLARRGRSVVRCGASRREASSENSRLTRASKYRRRTLKSARNVCVC